MDMEKPQKLLNSSKFFSQHFQGILNSGTSSDYTAFFRKVHLCITLKSCVKTLLTESDLFDMFLMKEINRRAKLTSDNNVHYSMIVITVSST